MEKRQRLSQDEGRPIPSRTNLSDSMLINWIDIDSYVSRYPLLRNPSGEAILGSTDGPVPVIRFFGVDEGGSSVAVNVHGFTPYFYCDPPAGELTESLLLMFKASLEFAVSHNKRGYEAKDVVRHILSIEVVDRQSIYGYTAVASREMLLIEVAVPSLVDAARTVLTSGSFRCGDFPERSYQTYESKLAYELRYMVDNGVVGCNWVELIGGTYSQRDPRSQATRAQREFDVSYNRLVSHPTKTHSKIGKHRILSFDIECMGRKGIFPEPKFDPVIQICNVIHTVGDNVSNVKKTAFVLKGCSPIPGVNVVTFDREEDLLIAWSQFVVSTDPDILTGYNIQNFDLPYLMNRACELGIESRFAYLGRVKAKKSTMKESTFSSAAFGTRTSIDTQIDGRVMVDMIQYMYRNHKLTSYSLNAVSAEFLGQQKDDVHHSIIPDLQKGSDDDRRRLAAYCVKDALLPLLLMNKLLVLVNHMEMARVTGVPLPYLFSKGQQIKVLSMLHRKARESGMVIPVFPRTFVEKDKTKLNKKGEEELDDVGYEGATVLEPKCAYYPSPIATLDFASLYPSIMQAHNLCYTTLLTEQQAAAMAEEDKERSPCGHWFVRQHVKKGLLPTILSELLTARSQAKKDMKTAKEQFEKDVMNGRQLALKVSANSVYGFTGATVGALPCIPISASVTAYGREMIEATKNEVEKTYTVENGYSHDAEVIYGDTDSVMVRFGVSTVDEAMKLGLDAAKRITKIFPPPISLEFEKVYFPYLLMAKKRYAGLYWTNPNKYDKMDCKGIETVRRDNCQLVRTVIDTCLRKILIDRDVGGAVEYAKSQISALLQGRVDMSMLVITKSYAKDDYKNRQPHVELVEKMKKRDAGSAPVVGDRVPYVMIQGPKKALVCEKSEDPIYALENNVPIDAQYYMERQLSKPLMRLFESILPDPKILLTGDHTRSIRKVTPSENVGILKFTVKGNKCLGCKVSLATSRKDQGICDGCEPRRQMLVLKNQEVANQYEKKFASLWSQCQRCTGSLHQTVICASAECPIFYARRKAQKDMTDMTEALKRLEVDF